MAFVRVDKSRQGGTHLAMPIVTMGAYLADGKKHKTKHIGFRISRPLLIQLGWKFDGVSVNVTVNEGTEKDSGYIQLVPTEPDLHTRRLSLSHGGKGNQGVSISITADNFRHYVLNDCPVSSDVVPHMVDGDALIIECPDWFRYNPQSVAEPEPSRVTPLNREQRRALATRVARNLKR